ncbi:Ig-like domain-containing protein [Vagococcus silagei]|uniref:BIG2 domain-containing protein n=1 Tax=Vagococcus silagei TaxID=2508885 RepID=A0A4S3B6U8_9ENTE|nr:Ig-like domain-containing protein [Vagococcus silagei]THB61680.1 hypothetical protein ESZ54_04305 [Vagococcus silagei]
MKKKILSTALFSTLLLGGIVATPVTLLNGNGIETNVVSASPSDFKGYAFNGYGTIVKKGYNTWQNFNWVKKGNSTDIFNQTVGIKYKYVAPNGTVYYSLYTRDNQWLGYLNSDAVAIGNSIQGAAVSTPKFIVMTNPTYPLYSNFAWNQIGHSRDLMNRKLKVKYSYFHYNGPTYYSLYNLNDEWLGYVNSTATQDYVDTGNSNSRVNHYLTVTKDNYPVYSNLNWDKKNDSKNLMNQTFHVKYKYVRNFRTYFSIYDVQGNWQGYIEDKAVVTAAQEHGAFVSENMYITSKNDEIKLYNNMTDPLAVRTTMNNMKGNPFHAKGKYFTFKGETFYSAYDGNGSWLGYVKASDVDTNGKPQGTGHGITPRVVTIKNKGKDIYNSFNFNVRDNTSNWVGKSLKATGYYRHVNGTIYYSVSSDSSWVGYISEEDLNLNPAELSGVKDHTVYVGTQNYDLMAGVSASDEAGNAYEITINGKDKIDYNTPGKYAIKYQFINKDDQVVSKDATVEVVKKPVFEGVANKEVKISEKDTFDPKKDVKVKDHKGKEMEITVTGTVDWSKTGQNTLTYSVKGLNDEIIKQDRIITVKDDRAIAFTGVEDVKQSVAIGTFDANAGVSLKDANGVAIPFTVVGNVVATVKGDYLIEYHATNPHTQETIVAKRKVSIIDVEPTSVAIQNGKTSMRPGQTQELQTKILPEDASKRDLTWLTSNAGVATVDATGKVTAVAPGTVEIMAKTVNGKTASLNITVTNDIKGEAKVTDVVEAENKVTKFKLNFENKEPEDLTVKSITFDTFTILGTELADAAIPASGNISLEITENTNVPKTGLVVKVTVVDRSNIEKEFTATIQ